MEDHYHEDEDSQSFRRDWDFGGPGSHVVIASIVGPLVAASLVYNRLFWRIYLVHTLGVDDLFIGASLVFLFALALVNLVGVSRGYGEAATSIHPDDLHVALKMFWLGQIFYQFTINLTKLSILTLYLRIFTKNWFVRTCWTGFVLVCAYAIASILASVFQCTPVNYFWHKNHPTAHIDRRHDPGRQGPFAEHWGVPRKSRHCINAGAFWIANAVFNISSDIIILVALLLMIWSLRLTRPQKFGLTCVFGLGIFVLITSVLRLTTLERSSIARDPLVGTVISTMWSMVESSTAVICACLPMCRTPLQRWWPKLVGRVKSHQSATE